ncbi:50S ribosomal protein L4 [Patescibacteria group bacterium]|nr:50S ribosomal protein L4 [Patescibacteria group bacterium]
MNKVVTPIDKAGKKDSSGDSGLSTTKLTSDAFGAVQTTNLKSLSEMAISRRSNQHRPTASSKTRGQVAGSTRKPWRQKGTGRARVGTKRTPLWRGGGIIFGPTSNRNYQKKINRALIVPSLRWTLQQKATDEKVVSISNLDAISSTKTKMVLAMLSPHLHHRGTLIITGPKADNLKRALANVSFVNVKAANQISFLDIVNARHILITDSGLNILQEKLK